ncbi:hypothetical protein CYLTODRAFT_399294 [Cylindrobasidium torrendii FP15055 ss-10]|uniref:Uncharacterized protein n=1 Tax=Cylindrobasidium torrendii FP15055 ss-10 TaxID=1314674 RepID=A0A0D7B7A3_9AGAR|nr:hypothetical protein CYLTODRAFT_399294 [Cylindrobasidium torrendii FP15055 ss-10]
MSDIEESSSGSEDAFSSTSRDAEDNSGSDFDPKVPNMCVEAFQEMESLFRSRYPHPFPSDDWDNGWGDTPRTIVELRMCALSTTLREKERWWEKVKDKDIRAKWRAEALEQGQDKANPKWSLTEGMVDYVLDELDGYAKLRDEATGIELACYERVWKSDQLVPQDLRDRLVAVANKLEDIPDAQKDWHPGSNKQVLDLVHPSLYPVVNGRTRNSTGAHVKWPRPRGDSDYMSDKFQWLPSDFFIDNNGEARLTSSYINNVCDADLYPIIDKLVTLAVPMWERVLSDLCRPLSNIRMKVIDDEDAYDDYRGRVGCIWRDENGRCTDPPYLENHDDEEAQEEWRARQPQVLPEALDAYTGALDIIKNTVPLKGGSIQVIVKLANIVLTPDNPKYAGGKWHVEGMLNENIVSTFIYYYDEENITASQLNFRTSIIEPCYHGQDDTDCSTVLYGMQRDSPLCQDLGGVKTLEGRCIAFPNIYQHQVQPFELKEASKPGHRKIIALFLVDPMTTIPSATKIPPQQAEWTVDILRQSLEALCRLPPELVDLICSFASWNTMSRAEAEVYRKELMEERSVMVKDHTEARYEIEFNMCEH